MIVTIFMSSWARVVNASTFLCPPNTIPMFRFAIFIAIFKSAPNTDQQGGSTSSFFCLSPTLRCATAETREMVQTKWVNKLLKQTCSEVIREHGQCVHLIDWWSFYLWFIPRGHVWQAVSLQFLFTLIWSEIPNPSNPHKQNYDGGALLYI